MRTVTKLTRKPHTLTKIRKSCRYFASVFSSSMRALYLLKWSYFSNFFAFAAASRFCCSGSSSSSSDPNINDFRADLPRDLDRFCALDTRGETVGKSTIGSGVSSAGEGVLAIGMPSTRIMSLRKQGEGGVPEVCPGLRCGPGKAGNVADLT